MQTPRKTHCKHGHKFKPNNETWFTDINGKRQRTCKKCYNVRRNKRCKLKYKNDEEYRERKKSNTRKYRERLKQCHLSPVSLNQSQLSPVY